MALTASILEPSKSAYSGQNIRYRRCRSRFRQLMLGVLLSSIAFVAKAVPGIDHGANDLMNFKDGAFALDVTDMKVKVQGGFVRVTRSWADGGWQFNRRWGDLQIESRPDEGGEVHALTRNGALYHSGKSDWLGTNTNVLLRMLSLEGRTADFNMVITYTGSGYVWNNRQGDYVYYDDDGLITHYRDRNNNQVTLLRDSNGNISQVRDTNGQVVMTYTYEAVELPQDGAEATIGYFASQVQDYTGRTVSYTYNADLRVDTVTDVRGKVWRYEYTPDGHLTKIIDPNGRATTILVGENSGRLKEYFDADGVGYKFEFGTAEGQVYQRRIDGEGRVVEKYFDGRGQPTREVRDGQTIFTATYLTSQHSGIRAGLTGVSPHQPLSAPRHSGRRVKIIRRGVSLDEPPNIQTERILVDQRGQTTRTHYDRYGNATSVARPDGNVMVTEYGTFNRPIEVTDYDGLVTRYDYGNNGNLTRLTEAAGTLAERTTEYEYDSHGNRTVIRYLGDANTQEAEYTFTYDDFGNVLTRTDPQGGVQRFTDAMHPIYDALGNAPVRVNERGHVWVYAYDPAGNLLSVTDPLARETSFTYNDSGDLVAELEPNAAETILTPNATGLPTEITNAAGHTTQIIYDAANQVTQRIDPLSNVMTTGYDGQARIESIRDAEGNVTAYGYQAGLLKSITYPTYGQAREYDSLDRVATTTDTAAGISQERGIDYDAYGNVTRRTDALNRVTQYGYDGLRQLETITNALDGKTTFTYDDRGNLLTATDPEDSTTTFAYDANDRLLSETRPEGSVRSFTYHPNGLLETVTNPEGEVTEYVYDEADQLRETRLYADVAALAANTPAKTVIFGYNALGLITDYDDGTTHGSYTYDALGRLDTVTVNYGPFTKSHSYTYDAGGRKATYTNPEGITYTYQYNGNGDFQGLTIPGEGQITVNQYQWLSPIRLTYPGGLTVEDERDGLLRLDLRTLKDQAGNPIASLDYGYNDENHITALERDDGSSSYGYDELYRLTESSEFNEGYTYDGVGNRLTEQGSQTVWAYNADHQLLAAETATYTYNDNGHRATKGEGGETLDYSYDLEERLVQITSSVGGTVATFAYDPFGRRIRKTVETATTYFHYDATGLIAEYDVSGALIAEYQYAPGSPWMTNPLFRRDGSSDTIYFYFNDHLGTPHRLFDSSGQIAWAGRYDAFGEVEVNVQLTSNPLRFPGQYEDQETGSHYNYFRDHDPSTGRYIESDPIGLQGGLNRYAYVSSNPLRYADPFGLVQMCHRDLLMPIPYARHCYARFDDGTTLSYDPSGVNPDPDSDQEGTVCTDDVRPEQDECIKEAMQNCEGENYNFTGFNCCHCVEQAMKDCGVYVPRNQWPNWPINPGPQPGEPGYSPVPVYDDRLGR